LDLFTRQTLIIDEPDFKMYDAAKIPSVDCPAMLEYGAGVFFKSAVHRWKFEDGTSSHIDLGPERTEALRKFVHREISVPRRHGAHGVSVLEGQAIPWGHSADRYGDRGHGAGIDTSMKALGFNQPLVKPVLVPLFPSSA
jgi:hypothetical protein